MFAKLIKQFALHPVAANLLMIIMIALGVFGLSKLNRQFLPTFSFDLVRVNIIWAGATAEDVEKNITIPLERELNTIDNLKEMTSTSRKSSSNIILEFKDKTDLTAAINQIRERIDRVRNLPSDAEDPTITQVYNYENVAFLLISSIDGINSLRVWVEKFRDDLYSRGMANIELQGLPEEELRIEIDGKTLTQLNMSLNDLSQRINNLSRDLPGGSIGAIDSEKELRSVTQKRDIMDFLNLPIIVNKSSYLTIDDIAKTTKTPREDETLVRHNGKAAVMMKISRSEKADSFKSAQILDDWYQATLPSLPASMDIKIFNESWKLIKGRIDLLLKNGASGLLLIIGILYLFLNRSIAFWVTVSIPVSFLAALFALYLFGDSISMVSLFAFIMSLGIIVDDSIVVGEEIASKLKQGIAPKIAVKDGALRMLGPVLASSLTTIAAFLPLMLVTDVIGKVIFTIPLVVVSVIIASLIEVFLILPGHIHNSFMRNSNLSESNFRKKFDASFNNFRENYFRKLVETAVKHRYLTVLITFCFLIICFAFVSSGRINFTFFPSPEGKLIKANIQFFAGTPKEDVRAFQADIEKALWQANSEIMAKTKQAIVDTAVVFYNKGETVNEISPPIGENVGSIVIELISPEDRNTTNKEFIELWQSHIKKSKGLENLTIFAPRGGPPGEDINVELSKATPDTLKQAASEIKDALSAYNGVYNIEDDMPYGKDQFILHLTPYALSLNLTPVALINQVRSGYQGALSQIYYKNQEEVEVRVMLDKSSRDSIFSLMSYPIFTETGIQPLEALADIEYKKGIDTLKHTDKNLRVNVTAEVDTSITNANKVLASMLTNKIPNLEDKYNVLVKLKGAREDEQNTLGDIKKGMLLAIVLIYIILAWVFSSYVWPIVVMSIIPFGIIGAFIGHYVMGIDLTILSLFGIFGLSGIVVNDSIILVSFYKDLRRTGKDVHDSIVTASTQRLRAVILTSITTIAGLTPLLFETSLQAQFLIPMAVSISFGIGFTTILVLVLIPALLAIVNDYKVENLRKFIAKA